ncbi:cellulose-binding domain-containing protein, partial [Vibrio cholerae]
GINPNGLKVYPEFPRGDHAAGGDQLIHNGSVWQANWWTNSTPSSADASWKAVCKI